jgi:transposase-like protein
MEKIIFCSHPIANRNGYTKSGTPRFLCQICGKSFVLATKSVQAQEKIMKSIIANKVSIHQFQEKWEEYIGGPL